MRAIFCDRNATDLARLHREALRRRLPHSCVTNGADALQILAAEPYELHVVTLGKRLHDMTGIDLLRRIRSLHPPTLAFAYEHPVLLTESEPYDRIFFKPHGVPYLLRAVAGVVGAEPEHELISGPRLAGCIVAA